jgi:hypothetical protein
MNPFGEVRALAVDGSGVLYAGGGFTNAGGTKATSLAQWSGSAWSSLGAGTELGAGVYALACVGSERLYAGGDFTNVAGMAASRVAYANLSGLWADAIDVGGGWKWSSWFGYFSTAQSPWIYHQEHGWLYPFGSDASSVSFWDAQMGAFWWTADDVYPYMYRFSDARWLWYLRDSADPRYFLQTQSGTWESW